MNNKKILGFTLVELMIVIAIVSVLAVIAMPAYSDYTRKARRADAKIALTSLAQAQETYHADYPRYASVIGAQTEYDKSTGKYILGCRTACQYNAGTSSAYSPDGHYVVAIANASAAAFTLTATVKDPGAQTKDTKCLAFALNSRGIKSSGNSADAAKGNLTAAKPDPNECW
jgi:type IV pilus assembly protein PilE